jgi:hypothetical protein
MKVERGKRGCGGKKQEIYRRAREIRRCRRNSIVMVWLGELRYEKYGMLHKSSGDVSTGLGFGIRGASVTLFFGLQRTERSATESGRGKNCFRGALRQRNVLGILDFG